MGSPFLPRRRISPTDAVAGIHPFDHAARRDWAAYRQRIDPSSSRLTTYFPDFLVVSTAKTGTTWLAENLRRHPHFYIPKIKEVRYFDTYWRVHDVDWYCRQFERAPGTLAGDVSPPYALLPSFAIEHIATLRPDLKIVILLREPVDRAWSQLRHAFRRGEAGFTECGDETGADIADVRFEDWLRAAVHDYVLSSGDYASIIRRWSACFPRRQIHIAFFEDAVADAERYLTALIRFLGSDAADFSGYPLREIINKGFSRELPPELRPWLVRLHGSRRREAESLFRKLGLRDPWKPYARADLSTGWNALPDWFDDFSLELGDGIFRARPKATPSRHWFRHYPHAAFLGDLLASMSADGVSKHARQGRGRTAMEDDRLMRILDGLAEPLLAAPS